MKSIRGSVAAKIAAWILVSVSGIGLLGCITTAFIISEEKIYENTKEETTEEAFSVYSDRYSAMVLDHMNTGWNEKYFADKNFRYGLIQADSRAELKKVNLNTASSYIERNFTGEADLETMHVFECRVGDGTYIYSKSPESLFGYYGISNGAVEGRTEKVICYVYDLVSGIIFGRTEKRDYPVKQLCFEVSGINELISEPFFYRKYYEYDPIRQRYLPVSAPEDVEISDWELSAEEIPFDISEEGFLYISIMGAEVNKFNYEDYRYGCDILSQESIRLSDFSDTLFCLENGVTVLGGYLNDSTVCLEATDFVIEEKGVFETETKDVYWLSVENAAVNIIDEDIVGTIYYVISYVEEPLVYTGNWMEGDLYVKSSHLIDFVYTIRYSIYGIMAVCAAGFCLSIIFLFCAAGYRKNIDEIKTGWVNKIPFEINMALLLLGVIFFWGVGLRSIIIMIEDITSIFWIAGFIFFLLCGFWLLLAFALEFAVRVKLGIWRKTTIIYKAGHFIFCRGKKTYRFFQTNLNLIWKVTLGFCTLVGMEGFSIYCIYTRSEFAFMFGICMWFSIKGVLFAFFLARSTEMLHLKEAGEHIAAGDLQYQVDTSKMLFDFKKHGENLNSVNAGLSRAVEEKIKSERFKTELITNVSHDIKTPLTSIINYVDLLGKEGVKGEAALEYIEVLERQSNRLKKLIEDLMEASKASTGNLEVNFERLEAGVFMVQTAGEFEEKTKNCGLELIMKKPEEPVYIMADGRHFWRVIDNLMNNICKYAQPQTRVYINLEVREKKAEITFRNTSKYPLNISGDELMERFVRGDSSRNTEGSGLGLSIAKSLMELMQGQFLLIVDGDLFKVILIFDIC